jgi:hypothetical protein
MNFMFGLGPILNLSNYVYANMPKSETLPLPIVVVKGFSICISNVQSLAGRILVEIGCSGVIVIIIKLMIKV